ncbi:MAG: hypothetical protein ACRDP5_24085 [Streptosporangiaceae bacterium]
MTVQTLTPTQDVVDGGGLNITALLATPTQTILQFANTGRERLIVVAGASAETVTVDIGTLILGQAVTNFSSVTLTSGDYEQFGPFHSVLNQPGGDLIQVTLSTITLIQVALLQGVGVS